MYMGSHLKIAQVHATAWTGSKQSVCELAHEQIHPGQKHTSKGQTFQ